jgi:TRAP-type uncharacterized transport system fused permease subunit
MGSVSGSAVANVVATGSFTIPMMKRFGHRPLLGNGSAGEVVLTMITCCVGLVASAAALDLYFLRRATPVETALWE